MKEVLLGILVLIAIAMIFLGYKTGILPPALTGIGFIIIAFLLHTSEKKHRS